MPTRFGRESAYGEGAKRTRELLARSGMDTATAEGRSAARHALQDSPYPLDNAKRIGADQKHSILEWFTSLW